MHLLCAQRQMQALGEEKITTISVAFFGAFLQAEII